MRYLLLLSVIFVLPCCATRPDGTKTFAGLDTRQWIGLGAQTSTAYLDARKQPPLTSAKNPVPVEPLSEAEPAPSWLNWGLGLLGL